MQTEETSKDRAPDREVAILTVVLRLPEDPDKRDAVVNALRLGEDFMGAHVTAASMEDAITMNAFLDERVDERLMQEARSRTKALHREM